MYIERVSVELVDVGAYSYIAVHTCQPIYTVCAHSWQFEDVCPFHATNVMISTLRVKKISIGVENGSEGSSGKWSAY